MFGYCFSDDWENSFNQCDLSGAIFPSLNYFKGNKFSKTKPLEIKISINNMKCALLDSNQLYHFELQTRFRYQNQLILTINPKTSIEEFKKEVNEQSTRYGFLAIIWSESEKQSVYFENPIGKDSERAEIINNHLKNKKQLQKLIQTTLFM
ncbi:predicted protein [Naegleria gruberi]|nr:uncharacterized protein NAEGRDRAFT_82345 [Naegleria gruberi]EFC35784.1 predicted protein [Naegleria gruberi]|eukprot:XP_002668528.1 predicted protein [Naegleria gruberi strain NEG-M]